MKNRFIFFLATLTGFALGSCQQSAQVLRNGDYKAVLITDANIELPFYFQVFDSAGRQQVAFLNGPERLTISELSYSGDSVFLATPLYDTEFRAKMQGDKLSGIWIKHLPTGNQQMPFKAEFGVKEGYLEAIKQKDTSSFNIAGRWSVEIIREGTSDSIQAIGEFVQEGTALSGTFLTNFGDYRYLGGTVHKGNVSLSSYSGSSATLFTGEFEGKDKIVRGKLYSGPVYVADWKASRNSEASLPDAYSLTKLKSGEHTLNFKFPDTNGEWVSLADDRFKEKVVVLQFLGSWCPNCMDETAFLSPFYKKYKDEGLEVIGLAYERYAEPEKAKKAVENLMKRFDVTYPVLLTGVTNKTEDVLKSLPQLQNFTAFPTTIILNKKGTVSSIHTGFDGPATGKAYTDYIKNFEEKIKELLAEK